MNFRVGGINSFFYVECTCLRISSEVLIRIVSGQNFGGNRSPSLGLHV